MSNEHQGTIAADVAALARLSVADLVTRGERVATRALSAATRNPADVLELAKIVVALRTHYRYEGRPDYAGQSWDARQVVGRIYGPTEDATASRKRLVDAVRRKIGDVLRDVLPTEELVAYGLRPDGPTARNRQRLQQHYMLGSAVLSGSGDRADADPLTLVTHALSILAGITDDRLAKLPADERTKLRSAAELLEDRVYALRMAVTD